MHQVGQIVWNVHGEIKKMLRHIEFTLWNNPKDNVRVSSLCLMGKLLKKCCTSMEAYLRLG